MLRYVHIGNQIDDDADQFTFYDTVTDKFVDIFDSLEDFRDWHKRIGYLKYSLERLEGLIPKK
jgi:hypothetical protein